MIKKILVLFVLFLFYSASFAQLGVKGGMNLSKISKYSYAEYKPGFHIGATYDIAMSEKFYFQPGLLFVLKGTKVGSFSLYTLQKGDVSNYGLEMPLNFSFRPKINSQVRLVTDAGLYATYGLFGNYKFDFEDYPDPSGSTFDNYRRFELGLNFGLGVDFASYYIGGSFQYGITEFEKESYTRNILFRLSLGYKFITK